MTRRELLQNLSLACAAACLGCRKDRQNSDWFAQELVCIHIFHPQESLPAPLLEKPAWTPTRRAAGEYFQIGLPELLVCTTRRPFLETFQYFWPFAREDFEQLQRAATVEFERATLRGTADIEELVRYLRERKESLAGTGRTSAVIFTFNDFTRHWTAAVVAACREAGVDEFVLFKDPSRPPYLCDYPAKQKGFKRPPP